MAGLMRSRLCSGPAELFMQWSGSCDLASDSWPSEKGAELDVPNLWCRIPRLTVFTRGRFSVKTLITCPSAIPLTRFILQSSAAQFSFFQVFS